MSARAHEPAPGLRPEEAFRYLLGSWKIEREVSGMATMAGTAEVRTLSHGQAEYSERTAVRTSDGTAFYASQSYLVSQTRNGFAMHFAATGELFQQVCFTGCPGDGLQAKAVHLCGEDRYDSEYAFARMGRLVIRHAVNGPRKNYVSVARYRRNPDTAR